MIVFCVSEILGFRERSLRETVKAGQRGGIAYRLLLLLSRRGSRSSHDLRCSGPGKLHDDGPGCTDPVTLEQVHSKPPAQYQSAHGIFLKNLKQHETSDKLQHLVDAADFGGQTRSRK